MTDKVGPVLQPESLETWKAMEELVDAGLVKSIGRGEAGAVTSIKHVISHACVMDESCLRGG